MRAARRDKDEAANLDEDPGGLLIGSFRIR